MQKIRKIPHVQFSKNLKISVWGLLAQKNQNKIFSKKQASSLFKIGDTLTSRKKSKKFLLTVPEINTDKRTNR